MQSHETYHKRDLDGPETQPGTQGVGVVIVNLKDELLVVEEKVKKPLTGRYEQQISIPLETAKVGEATKTTLLGAMAEVINDEGIRTHAHNFYRVSPYLKGMYLQSRVGDRLYAGSMEFIIYNGDMTTQFVPTAISEVANPHWSKRKDFLESLQVRPLAREIVKHMTKRNIFHLGVQLHTNGLSERVFERYFSIEQFHEEREKKTDVIFIAPYLQR